MEVAVPEEPQKKIFRARKTMKMSDRQQLEVLHSTLAAVSSNSSASSSSRPQTPLVNGTHTQDVQKGKEKEKDLHRKETGTKSPTSPSAGSSPLPSLSLSLSRSPSPAVAQSQNPSPLPSVKRGSEKGKAEEKKGEKEKKNEKKLEETKADKTETCTSTHGGSSVASNKKGDLKKTTDQVSRRELVVMDIDASLENGSVEEKDEKSSKDSSSPSGSPAGSLECDPEVKEGFLCLSEEDEGQAERDEMKEKSEKMDTDAKNEEKMEREKGCKAGDGTGNGIPVGKKRSFSPEVGNDVRKDGGSKEGREGKRARVEGVELEAQLELKITANAGSRLKLEKVVQQLVEERLRILQLTVFDRGLQELKERVEKIDTVTKQQNALQHISTLQAKITRLTKKFGAANQASENSKKAQEQATANKATATTNTTPTTQRTVRTTMDPRQPSAPPSQTSSTATPTQPKPLSTPTTPTSSALAAPAPILQIISTTTSSTPASSTTSLTGQAHPGTLLLQTRPSTGVMTTSSATSGSQPVSIQPLLIQLPLAMANGQGGTIAGGVGLIPVSSLAPVNSINKPKTTTATTAFILQKTAANVASCSSTSSLATSASQVSLGRAVYQGGTGTVSSPNAAVSVTSTRTPTQCATVVGVATASSSPATMLPAATGSAAVAGGPGAPSASAMTSKTDNQASNSAPGKPPAQPARPKGSVIDLTEDDDDVQVTGVQKATIPSTATATQRPPGPPPPLVSSASVAGRSVTQHRPSVDSPSKSRPGSSSSASLPPLPLAPTPPARLPADAVHTSPPQQPQLKLARVQSQNGIVLSWCVAETDRNCAAVDSYHLYAYHQDHQGAAGGSTSTQSLWKKIGEVKALPLPMACTLTQFVSGSTYYFAVRAKDVYGRFGPFCEPQCTDVINPTSSGTS